MVSRDGVLEGSRAYFRAYFFGLVLPLLGFGFGRGKELAGLDFRFQDLPRGYGIGYCSGVQASQSSSGVEQRTHKPLVGGSNPSSGTNFSLQ